MIYENLLSFSLLFVFFAALFGAIIGSFLNVVIHRVPRGEFFASTRSRCPSCEGEIKFYDNIPILSYLLLGGKCRNCQTHISARYPLVEALTAMLFALVAYTYLLHAGSGSSSSGGALTFTDFSLLAVIFDCMFVASMLALIFIDAELMILPNKITYPGAVLTILIRLIVPNTYGTSLYLTLGSTLNRKEVLMASILNSLAGALFGAGLLWFVGWSWKRLRGVDAMGLGDVKMMVMVGFYLGLPLTVLTIFLGFFSGALIGTIVMYKSAQRDTQMQLPFGIFLGAGAITSLLFGANIIGWYMSQFR